METRPQDKHRHEMYTPHSSMWGAAIDLCLEDDQGRLFVSNGEYDSQVNYCPFCGYKAPTQIDPETCPPRASR